jgi:hypothetical protein
MVTGAHLCVMLAGKRRVTRPVAAEIIRSSGGSNLID